MKRRWIKDYCPYAKDQGFMAVVGDVVMGESVFGFSHTQLGVTDTIVLNTATNGKVKQMKNNAYRVQVTKVSAGSITGTAPFVVTKTKVNLSLKGEIGEDYDIVVIGKIAY